MNIATLGVAIDPTKATAGAETAKKALKSLATEAKTTAAAMEGAGKAAGSATAAAGRGASAAAGAHQGVLSRMAASIRGFFAQANQSASQAGGMFTGMVGSMVRFLQNLLSFIPGTTGLFAGLAGAAGSAATSMAGVAAAGGGMMLALGPLVAVLAAVVAGLVALGASVGVTMKAINAAASVEELEVQFIVLIGSVEKAKRAMEDLRQFADVTPFDTASVMQFGQMMLNAGTAADELTTELRILGDASMGNLEKMKTAVSAYTQTMSLGKLETEDFKRMQEAGIPVMEGLEKHYGKTAAAIREMMSDGKVTFADLQAGMRQLAGEGGRLAGMMDVMSETWNGKISTIQSRIETLFATFGRPIMDALKPALDEFDAALQRMIPHAEHLGRVFAGMIVSQDWDAVWRMVGLGFEVAMKAAAQRAFDAIRSLFTSLFDKVAGMADAAMKSAQAGVKSATGAAYFAMGGTLNPASTNYQQALAADKPVPGIGYPEPIGPGLNDAAEELGMLVNQFEQIGLANEGKGFDWSGLKEPDRKPPGGAGGGGGGTGKSGSGGAAPRAADEFRGDAYIMREFAKQMAQMQALQGKGQMTGTEFAFRSEKLKDSTVNQLGDPKKYEEALGQWRVFQEEKARIAEAADKRIEAGTAGWQESFSAGLNKAADQWGNASQQMARLGTGVANSLSSNFTNAFMSMVDGSKSASEAFRDMAIAILNDIAKMIIQLLVELAIRTAIKSISGFSNGGSVGATNPAGEAQIASNSVPRATAAGYASGGPVWGGNGGIDDIPAYLTAGEYVIPKDAAEYYGTRFLDAVRDRKARRVGFAEGGSVASKQIKTATAATAGRPSGDGVSVSFSVNVSGEGSAESQAEKRKRAERLGKQMESMARQVVRDEMRSGGALSNR